MSQKLVISALTEDHRSLLAEQRAAIADIRAQMVAHGDAPAEMDSLDFVQLVLVAEIIPDDAIPYQEAVGVLIGDRLVARGMVWRSVEDEWGDMPAVCHPAKAAVAYPMASVVKRFERGERVFDVNHFAEETLRMLEQLVADGDVGDYAIADTTNGKGAQPAPRPFMTFVKGLIGKKPIS